MRWAASGFSVIMSVYFSKFLSLSFGLQEGSNVIYGLLEAGLGSAHVDLYSLACLCIRVGFGVEEDWGCLNVFRVRSVDTFCMIVWSCRLRMRLFSVLTADARSVGRSCLLSVGTWTLSPLSEKVNQLSGYTSIKIVTDVGLI